MFNCLLFNYVGLSYISTMALVISTGGAQLLTLLTKLNLSNRLLSKIQHLSTWNLYSQYRVHLCETLTYFSQYNALYGKIFTAFCLVNCPFSAYMVVLIIFERMSTYLGLVFVYSYAALQLVCLFAIHYFLIRFSKRFHQSGSVLLSWIAQNMNKIGDHRSRIRCSLSIAAIHVNNRYGITYAKCGLVTLKTFAKVRLLKKNVLF